jgi:hypothetical protein
MSFNKQTVYLRQFFESLNTTFVPSLIIVQDKMGIYRTNLAVAGGVVNSPELVRMEVNITKTDFNVRLKQVTIDAHCSGSFYLSDFV